MRLRRLQADWDAMKRLAEMSPLIDVTATGIPPEVYIVTFRCKGLVKQPEQLSPSITAYHRLEIYLHKNYPRLQPRLTWLTQIFHPNILSHTRNGGICIGAWTPAESLADLVVRIAEMVQYKSYNPTDPLDTDAAVWAVGHAHFFPVDPRPVLIEPDTRPVSLTSATIEVEL